MQGGRERAPVAIPESLKALLESLLVPAEESHFFADMLVGAIFVFRGKKVHRQGRHDGSRPEIRSKHGENHRFGEGHKEEFRDAGQEEHRNEYDANANRRNERRHGNLRCAVQDGLHGLFSHGQVAVDVFNLHGGILVDDATVEIENINRNLAIRAAPSRMAYKVHFPMARLRQMSSISTVASSTRMPTASARPPKVMMLIVSPKAPRAMTLTRMDKGMEMAMISVLFQFPRKSRIMTAVRQAAISASRITPWMAARTNSD